MGRETSGACTKNACAKKASLHGPGIAVLLHILRLGLESLARGGRTFRAEGELSLLS